MRAAVLPRPASRTIKVGLPLDVRIFPTVTEAVQQYLEMGQAQLALVEQGGFRYRDFLPRSAGNTFNWWQGC